MKFEKVSIEYLLSRNILSELKNQGLITENEFNFIDAKNKKSFKTKDNLEISLIS